MKIGIEMLLIMLVLGFVAVKGTFGKSNKVTLAAVIAAIALAVFIIKTMTY